MAVNAVQTEKTVADPNAAYESMRPLWLRNRAVCSGERFVKEYDSAIDKTMQHNLLIPFSPSMSAEQYNFYRAEAELPGIVAQYSKMVVGGLLRKKPQIDFPEGTPDEIREWILNEFGEDSKTLAAFLDDALWEEMQTSRSWVLVDYPDIENPESLTRDELLQFKPYPILWKAENVINWTVEKDKYSGTKKLTRLIIRYYEEDFEKNEFHSELVGVVDVHELVEGKYRIRKYREKVPQKQVQVVNGKRIEGHDVSKAVFELESSVEDIQFNGQPLTFIPAWPLNGGIECQEPVLTQLVDKEVSLYNKVSRRNHLLYGASTYTPVITSNMSDTEFSKVVNAGLGSWLLLQQGDTASILETPTAALQDMDRAILASIEEMAKLGVRMLTPEVAQSGVALDIRNAAQTAQLGTLNAKISSQMSSVIAFMINWRYGTELKASDIKFSMSSDFNPTPLGEGWLRLVTEWYQAGLIPRSVWLQILKQNDIVPPEYDDALGQQEITQDEMILTPSEQAAALQGIQQ